MRDIWEFCMELSDIFESLSTFREGKSEDEVDVYRYSIFVIARYEAI